MFLLSLLSMYLCIYVLTLIIFYFILGLSFLPFSFFSSHPQVGCTAVTFFFFLVHDCIVFAEAIQAECFLPLRITPYPLSHGYIHYRYREQVDDCRLVKFQLIGDSHNEIIYVYHPCNTTQRKPLIVRHTLQEPRPATFLFLFFLFFYFLVFPLTT